MKKLYLSAIAALFLLSAGCSHAEEFFPDPPAETICELTAETAETEISPLRSDWHWICKNQKDDGNICGMFNAPWRSVCVVCQKPYSKSHGDIILAFLDIIEMTIDLVPEGLGGAGTDPDLIQLPNLLFISVPAPKWYDTPNCRLHYERLQSTSAYRLSWEYAEGADYGWYQTVRVLYPQYHRIVELERAWSRFIASGSGREIESSVKAGARAALDAFAVYR